MTDLKFICTSCGACCKRVKDIKDFPEPINKDGSCSHYNQESKKCSIYESRPDICRVETSQALLPQFQHMSLSEYFKFTNSICNIYISQDKLGDEYLIDIKAYDV